jgi:hypothetical protein
LNLRKEPKDYDTDWLIKLRFKECPENIIEMIASKLDENNHEETEMKELWEKNEIQIIDKHDLKDKLNKIISKLNNKKLEYYNRYDFEYNLIL